MNGYLQALEPVLEPVSKLADRAGVTSSHMYLLSDAVKDSTELTMGLGGAALLAWQSIETLRHAEDEASHSAVHLSLANAHFAQDATAMRSAISAVSESVTILDGQERGAILTTKGLAAEFNKALTPQLNLDNAALTYHEDLTTLIGDLKKSHDEIGFQTAAQQQSYGAFLQVVSAAAKFSDTTDHSTTATVHMREALRESITELDRLGIHGRQATVLLDDLRKALADIPSVKDIQINIDKEYYTSGNGQSGLGFAPHGPGSHSLGTGGPGLGASTMALAGLGSGGHGGSTMVINNHFHIAGSVVTEMELSRVMRDRQNDHTFLNAGAGLSLPGRGRGL